MLEKIKNAGGFIDFGAIGSMPLGYLADGTVLSTTEYYECKKLVAQKKVDFEEKTTNIYLPKYLTSALLTGDLYKIKTGQVETSPENNR